MRRLQVFDDLESLSRVAADGLAGQIREAVAARGRCALGLTGGRTPRRMYELLAERHRETIPWGRVDLFWGDERYVPYEHPQSNYRMAKAALLDRVPVPSANVHPMPTDHPEPSTAARSYEELLRGYFRGRPAAFDVLLLGLAANGHVASLFPHQPVLRERTRWVVAVDVPADPPRRLTITYPLINQAHQVAFLVAGSTKAEAVQRALRADGDVDEAPAAGVAPAPGDVTWWLDRQAAALVGPEKGGV